MATKKPFEEMTVKEFMEWFVSEYEGHWLSSDYTLTINRLEGYRLAKKETEEHYIFASAVELLRDAQNLLRVVQERSKWKYKQ